ncbi:hypothetical protein DFH11DRAFT_1805979 [Phellopilus nigrolimitatus]|nr:hypothetical protein DFH11DRAFT_1805979 [Phellopilus nigrolimitatus]
MSKKLYRRKGGGGGGGHGGGEGGGGHSDEGGEGSSGGSSGSGGASSGARTPVSIGSGSSSGGKTSAISYGSGGGKAAKIPSGQLFAGRSQGGGTRGEVFGSRTYGSGYPGVTGSRGVAGLGFPFYFWPVVWGTGHPTYLHSTEYGDVNNSSRPGGALTTVPFSSSSGNSTFHVVSDSATTTSLRSSVAAKCSSVLASNSKGNQAVIAFAPTNKEQPQPEQAVQYFRASSITLTLDGYSDTAALAGDGGANEKHTPLPGWVDTNLLNCLNQTIGAAAPLVDGAPSFLSHPIHGMSAVSSMWLIWLLLTAFF